MSVYEVVDGQMAVRAVNPSTLSEKNDQTAYAVVDGQECVVVTGVNGGDLVNAIEKAKFIPDADESLFEKVYLFTGLTNTKYTHGHIYECQKTATYTSTVTFDPTTISCSGSDFATFVSSIYDDVEAVKKGTMTFLEDGNLWVFVGQDDDGNTLVTYQQYTEDFEDAGFTFSGTFEDEDVVAFECSISEDTATYSWVDINS